MFHPIGPSRLQLALAFISLVLFAAAVVEKRLQTRGSPEPATGRSRLSLAGIAMQTLAFGLAGGGPFGDRYRANSRETPRVDSTLALTSSSGCVVSLVLGGIDADRLLASLNHVLVDMNLVDAVH
jgi:hypothetical protein